MTLLKESAERVKDGLENFYLDYTVKNIIRRNLDVMQSSERGGMGRLRESIGGNAAKMNNHPCMAANFFYDKNGEIKYFGNRAEDAPGEFRDLSIGTFKITIDFESGAQRIIGVYNIDKEETLLLTASHYNKIFDVW